MANAFNSVLRGVIFQEFHAEGGDIIQFIPFVCAFYLFESPLFCSHHNHESDDIIIPFAIGIHQGDPLGGTIHFNHFKALRSIVSHLPSCVFPSIVNDTHIISPFSIVSSVYEHF
jgi:hypothetical protein